MVVCINMIIIISIIIFIIIVIIIIIIIIRWMCIIYTGGFVHKGQLNLGLLNKMCIVCLSFAFAFMFGIFPVSPIIQGKYPTGTEHGKVRIMIVVLELFLSLFFNIKSVAYTQFY